MANFNKITLKNGLRVITVPQKESLSATILVLVEAGSKYETKDINGLSHFLEHMNFKGTKSRPNALIISSELDKLGAQYNAFTGQEYTGYYAKVKSDKIQTAIDIVADLYSNPIFDPAEIEKEKGVIIEEINMYEDLPMRRVGELFEELLYGDQPAGWPIGGQKDVIRRLNRDDFIKYRGEHYVSKATAVIVVGAFDENKTIKQLESVFAAVPQSKKFGKNKTKESQKKPAVRVQHKKSDQTHLVLGCRAFDTFDDRRYALEVLSDILGGGMSSRLFQNVREKLGAAYYVRSSNSLSSDHGYWEASAGVDHTKLNQVIKAIIEELGRLKKYKVGDEELQRAKDHLGGGMVLGLESSDAQALFYGMQEIIKQKIITPEEVLQKIQAVTATEIQKVAKELFQNKKLNLAIIGPYQEEHQKNLEALLNIR